MLSVCSARSLFSLAQSGTLSLSPFLTNIRPLFVRFFFHEVGASFSWKLLPVGRSSFRFVLELSEKKAE